MVLPMPMVFSDYSYSEKTHFFREQRNTDRRNLVVLSVTCTSSPELGISIPQCFCVVIVQSIKTVLTIVKIHVFTMA